MEHQYSIYGVALSSDIAFDFPSCEKAASEGPHLRFTRVEDEDFAAASAPRHANDSWFSCDRLHNQATYLRWSGLYEFLVTPCGTCVKHRALDDGDPAVLQNFLFGQVLSFALIRQTVEPLHAAVVDVGGYAIALLGDCTYGKSTLAASLLRAGCRLLSDDLLVVRDANGCVMAHPGAGWIKLLPDSATAVLGDVSGGVPMIPNAEKRVFRLDRSMVQGRPVPLRAFFVLPTPDERAGSDRIGIHRIGRAQLFYELVKNTFVRYLEDGCRLHQNFSSNSHLASSVDGYCLRYPPGIDKLAGVGQAILDHVRDHSQGDTQ